MTSAEAKAARAMDVMAAHRIKGEWKPPQAKNYLALSGNPKLPYVTKAAVEYHHTVISVHIPKGFKTDLASVPAALFWLINPLNPKWRIAIVHDRLYGSQAVDREVADALFVAGLKHDGVNWLLRRAAWLVVRLFGGRHWKK